MAPGSSVGRRAFLKLFLAAAASHAQRFDPAPRFVGWQGERAILKIDDSGASYCSLGRDANMRRLKSASPPAHLRPGHTLVADYAPLGKDVVVLEVEANRADAQAMDRALEAA